MAWETRLSGNTPKFIDIFPVGAADSSGAIARVPIRDGYLLSNLKTAVLLAEAPALLKALEGLLSAVQRSGCADSGPAQDAAADAIFKAKGGL